VEGRHKDTKEEQLSKKLELDDTYMEESKIHRRVCRGIDKVLENIGRCWSIDEVKENLHVSPSWWKRVERRGEMSSNRCVMSFNQP
jgi:hypothetical protein